MTPAEKESRDKFKRNLDTLHEVFTGWIRAQDKDGVEYFGFIHGLSYAPEGCHGVVDIIQQDGTAKRLNIQDLEDIVVADPPSESDSKPAKVSMSPLS
jgi:hypothetical protein